MSRPKKIHIATRAYLERFESGGRLISHRVRTGASAPCRAAAVAYRKNWWGNTGEITAAVERALSQYETPASEILGTLPETWPVDGERRASLAAFIAIHSIRTPAFRAKAEAIAETTISERRQHWRHLETRFDRAAQRWRRDEWRWPQTMGRQIPRVASLLASMQWMMVAFDDPLLVTSDQPVVPVPIFGPNERREISALPSAGYLNTIEFRFPIDPRHALLLIWADGKDPLDPLVGDLDIACDLNRAVRAQADEEWLSTPLGPPRFVRPPFADVAVCSPIAPRLVAGYDRRAVEESIRRRKADAIQRELIADYVPGQLDTIRWVYAA